MRREGQKSAESSLSQSTAGAVGTREIILTILESVSRFLLICTLYSMVSAEAVGNAFTGLHSTRQPSVVMLVTRGGADKGKEMSLT